MRTILIAAAAALAAGAPAWAETFNVNGTGHGQSHAKPMPVSETLVAVQAHTDYDGFEGEDPMNPLASAKGPCFGSVLIDKGMVSGGGLCHYTDADGDNVVIDWTATGATEDGRTTGDWMVVGGTGKWDGASGGGTFNAGTDAMEKYTNIVTGEVTLN